ncbi:hypothetical protein NKH18_15230 [Streptomyces sp. M10(2022)]
MVSAATNSDEDSGSADEARTPRATPCRSSPRPGRGDDRRRSHRGGLPRQLGRRPLGRPHGRRSDPHTHRRRRQGDWNGLGASCSSANGGGYLVAAERATGYEVQAPSAPRRCVPAP